MVLILSFDVGIKNLAYTVIENNTKFNNKLELINTTNLLELKSINIVNYLEEKYQNVLLKKIPILELTRGLLNALDILLIDIITKYNIDIILIENQPVTMNPKMKTIQIILYTWLVYKTSKSTNIKMFNARNKLECYVGPEYTGKLPKSKYARRKKLSIIYVTYMLNHFMNKETTHYFTNIRNYFMKSKKKDDLSDCILQALTYLFKMR